MKKLVILFIISLLLVIGLPHPSPSLSQSSFSEIRGVWITKNDSDVWLDSPKLQSSIKELAQLNFNTIYPVFWNSGYVSYDSPVAKRTGIQTFVRQGFQNQDIIADIIAQGHLNKLLVIPWFEFGFMTPPTSELAIKHPDWLTAQRNGNQIGDSAAGQVVWLNPFHPQVQQFITDLVLEICTLYPVDGIQFDDHMALPKDFGYDPYTVNLYKQETKKDPPANSQDQDWLKWRADKITEFMERLHKSVKEVNPKLIFSVAPNPYHTAYNSFLQDWKTWVEKDIVDELIIQVYRSDLSSFVNELNRGELQSAKENIPVGIAILTGLRNKPISINLIEDKVKQARRYGLGVSFFYYESLWQETVTETADFRKSVLQALFYNPQPRLRFQTSLIQ
jgi:uncharacterized lipoprotein YddW (UPF0748 family)